MALIVKVLKKVVSWDECQESLDTALRNWHNALDGIDNEEN